MGAPSRTYKVRVHLDPKKCDVDVVESVFTDLDAAAHGLADIMDGQGFTRQLGGDGGIMLYYLPHLITYVGAPPEVMSEALRILSAKRISREACTRVRL